MCGSRTRQRVQQPPRTRPWRFSAQPLCPLATCLQRSRWRLRLLLSRVLLHLHLLPVLRPLRLPRALHRPLRHARLREARIGHGHATVPRAGPTLVLPASSFPVPCACPRHAEAEQCVGYNGFRWHLGVVRPQLPELFVVRLFAHRAAPSRTPLLRASCALPYAYTLPPPLRRACGGLARVVHVSDAAMHAVANSSFALPLAPRRRPAAKLVPRPGSACCLLDYGSRRSSTRSKPRGRAAERGLLLAAVHIISVRSLTWLCGRPCLAVKYCKLEL
jgi:hypothetical protein